MKWITIKAALAAALVGALLSVPVSQAQQPATSTAKEVNKKMCKLFGAGGFKGLPSYGTGIVISKNGYILTVNNHILSSQDLRVHLYDGRFFHAKVVAREPELDIALLKLEEPADNLPHFNIETEAGKPLAPVGAWVLAFSNQFSIATREEPMSVQHGVIAAYTELMGRKGVFDAPFQGKAYFLDVIACNPGAAGGALTNSKGDLIGILGRELKNKLSDSWINYAVPLQAKVELERSGKPVTVSIADFVRDGMAGKYKPGQKKIVAKGPGAFHGILLVPNPVAITPPYVETVQNGSPADKAGLQADDLIVYVDGELVQSIKNFRDLINSYKPGDQVRLDVQRGSSLETVTITLEEHPKKK